VTDTPQSIIRILVFRVGDDLFAAEVDAVERVLRYEAPRRVPDLPAWIEGVIEHRGQIVPVINLASRFELPAAPPTSRSRCVIFAVGSGWVAVVVDGVVGVTPIPTTALTPPPPLVRGLAGTYLRGLAQRDGHTMLVLDAGRILSTTERLALERAATPEITNA
jgi:purine-binding chemotaxis protein CheW